MPDSELLATLPALLTRERAVLVEVIACLVEIDRRRLYLEQACASLRSFCIERLGYSEDEASKRVRVVRLARRLPRVLDELQNGGIHLTGLFLLAAYLTEENAESLLNEARGASRQQIEHLLARRFPRPDVEARIDSIASQPVLQLAVGEQSGRPKTSIGPGAGTRETQGRLEPLSAASYRVQFTASSDLYAKIEQAKQLVSHAVPGVDLAALMERAIDALIEKEIRRKRGADKKRKRRPQKPGSRHVAVEVADAVWQRDGSQCTFVDGADRRCSERRFLTLEHEHPHARNGPSTVENLSLLCAAHNAQSARKVFGEEHIEKKRRERAERAHTEGKVRSALCQLGFRKPEVARVLAEVGARQGQDFAPQPVLHACLAALVR